jgi:ATP-dependent DNA helicase
MKRIEAGSSGRDLRQAVRLSELDLSRDWFNLIEQYIGDHPLRPVQAKALAELGMLETRRHLVVCAPTNSGKSLIGHLALTEALRAGRRAVLLEPLRALAQEKAEELADLLPLVNAGDVSPIPPRLQISTGDYRLESETFQDPPPKNGELIVATPERLEAILRNPANQEWVDSIGCLVVDEAHLIGNARRGPTIELLIATLLASQRPPRIVLLSATAGEPERLRDWLTPCDLIEEESRTPPLSAEVWGLEGDDDVDAVLCEQIGRALEVDGSSALVFVYRRQSTEALAKRLQEELGQPVLAYHSGMSAAARKGVRTQYSDGTVRCAVATTALAMGVNLPATHVYVRDTTFHGYGRVAVDELLQMVGRAGRGEREGFAAVLVRPTDKWQTEELATALRTRDLPPLRSAFEGNDVGRGESDPPPAAQVLASCLSRCAEAGLGSDELRSLLTHTFAGPALGALAGPSLDWLVDPARLLAYEDEDGKHRLTALGLRGVRAVLPLGVVSGFGQLIRDLLWLDPNDRFLDQWSPIDHLISMALLTDRGPALRRFSEALAEQVDGWHESRTQEGKSFLFREWTAGSVTTSKADELLGSLGIVVGNARAGAARKTAYVAMLKAIVLDERSRGVPIPDLERRWGIDRLEGVEESWRDTTLWLLAGQAQLCDLRCFYYHLVENCEADAERIRRVKMVMRRMRNQVFGLMEQLKYCSALGPVMYGVRSMMAGQASQAVGPTTIRRLEEGGVTSLQELANLDVDAMIALGVQRRFAKQIRAYVRRRLR